MTERGAAESRSPRASLTRGSLLQASCWLAVVLVIAKAASGEIAWWPGIGARLLTLVASSCTDVLFALALGVVGELALIALRKHRRARLIVAGTSLAFFTLCAAYAIAAIGLFRYFNRPLTYDLLALVGNAITVRSSILARVTLPIGLGIAAAPLVFLLCALLVPRRRRITIVTVSAALLWAAVGGSLRASGWKAEELEYLAWSPHAELLRTAVVRLLGGHRPTFPNDFPPDYVDEFRTFGARGGGATAGFELPAGVARPRNVIVVVLESVGTKYLSLYGYGRDTTPNLVTAAPHALVSDNCYAQASFTYASFRPLAFSAYPGLPWHYGLIDDARPLPQTLAALMRAHGARTSFITSGDLDWADQRWLLERSSSFDLLQGAADLGCPLQSSWGTDDRCAFDRLLGWIDERPNESFCAMLWTDQTHDPFFPVGAADSANFLPPEDSKFAPDLTRYLQNLHDADAQIGRLLAALRERGIADDTLVVVTGDHGEAFADPHQQRGHAWSVYDEEVRVPLLIWNPRLFPTETRVDGVAGHIDLNPTVAELLGIAPSPTWQGHSLFDPARPPRAYFMAIGGGDVFGVREGAWKYVFDVASGRESLFNLAADPLEQHNVAGREPERSTKLRRRLAAWVTFEDAYLWGDEN